MLSNITVGFGQVGQDAPCAITLATASRMNAEGRPDDRVPGRRQNACTGSASAGSRAAWRASTRRWCRSSPATRGAGPIRAQIAFDPASARHFANAYDGFWKILGGVDLPGPGYPVALPFHFKPRSEIRAKHRRRAGTLEPKLQRPPVRALHHAPLHETESV